MQRITSKKYQLKNLILGMIYIAMMLVEWPYARHAASLPLKTVLAITPLLPMFAVIWLFGLRVVRSDELEQRVHLIALSMATGVVAALSMVGGFLAAAGVLLIDGDILIWVFPTLCIAYAITHLVVGRRYGGMGCQ